MIETAKVNTEITRLVKNINRLKQNYLRLKEENQKLFEEKQNLLKKIEEKDQIIDNLKKQIENLKITNALIIGDDKEISAENLQEIKHSAKIKLNQIIREIDTAIKILSTNELQ